MIAEMVPTLTGFLRKLFFGICFVKLLLLAVFSSDYQDRLFLPFVQHFLNHWDNPWEFFFLHSPGGPPEFPYHPLLLYILAIFYAPIHFFHISSVPVVNFFFKLPTFLADLFLFSLLLKRFPSKQKEVILFYFLSPIVLYACYLHSQIDLLPTALLFFSVFQIVERQIVIGGLAFGLGLGMKFHTVAAIPLIAVFLLRQFSWKELARFLVISGFVYFFLTLPYLGSNGFWHMVLQNPKQQMIFEATYNLGEMKLYLLVLASLLLFGRFARYSRINNELLFSFLAILFSVFVLLIKPSPGWYVWTVPFFSYFFIQNAFKGRGAGGVYWLFGLAYVIYYLFFYHPDYPDLTFLGYPISWKLSGEKARNLSFTFLEACLMMAMFLFYRYGVKSNLVYQRFFATVIGVGGDSGAGKSTVVASLCALIGSDPNNLEKDTLVIESDGEHKWERGSQQWETFTHLNPMANDLYQQAEHIRRLKTGHATFRSDYDHSTGTFLPPKRIEPRSFLILCGLHLFFLPKLRVLTDIKLFLDTEQPLREHWKILRDTQERGYTPEVAKMQFEARLADGEKYIQPQKKYADLIIHFFSSKPFEIGSPHADPGVQLKVFLDSSLPIDRLASWLEERGKTLIWDYSEDLRSQFVIFPEPWPTELLSEASEMLVPASEEILYQQPVWQSGFHGILQFLVLLILSERRTNAGSHEAI